MANQRKQIIVNEITFWKQNKLLPAHYCDFLMTLYTEGEHAETEVKALAKQSIIAKEKRGLKLKYLSFPVIAVLLIALMYILASTLVIVIAAAVFGFACIVGAFYFAKKNNILGPLLQLTGALVLLLATLNICIDYFPGEDMALYIGLIVNCLLWFMSGILMKLSYFTIAGGLGLLAIVVYSSL